MRWVAPALLACGCRAVFGLDPPATVDATSEQAPAPFVVAHLADSVASAGTEDLILLSGMDINTTVPATAPPLPAGAVLEIGKQLQGPEVAILRVRRLVVPINASVSVLGSRPLIIIASHDVTIDGNILASATGQVPGPGGASAGMGASAGAPGQRTAPYLDAGGGGAGGGTPGALGGRTQYVNSASACNGQTFNDSLPGGSAGLSSIDVDVASLEGGSGGGTGGSGCAQPPGGAGGGAIQISTPATISIAGKITAGGGGGAAGMTCTGLDGSAGGGGGAGGVIYVQASSVTVSGTLAANGGGGGGGSTGSGMGSPGADAVDNATPAPGGTGLAPYGGAGGAGGARGTPPTAAPLAPDCGNGGGGGGAVGRIVVRAMTYTEDGLTTPSARELPF